MKIGMYLGPSKYWWAYLGIRSNPAIAKAAQGFDRAVFFDDPARLPHVRHSDRRRVKYFCIFWDGIRDSTGPERVRLALGPEADVTALVVGEASCAPCGDFSVLELYAEGPMLFSAGPLSFDLRTSIILLGARIKAFLMPLKNMVQGRGKRREVAGLLFGRPRIVFCGSYGTPPGVMAVLCASGSVDPRLFDGYEYFRGDATRSFERYCECLHSNSLFLASLYDRGAIDAGFLRSAVHLLGRGYFIERLRSLHARMFVHGYGRANINVYTTPWYRQHLFLDFGSMAGPGNYPRLADLQYFRKRFVVINLPEEASELAALARSGKLEQHWDEEWRTKEDALKTALFKCRNGYLESTPIP